MILLSEVRYNVNQKIERSDTLTDHAFELCRDGVKTSKAKITSVEEFKRSLDQVFKWHPYATQQAKFAYLLEHTTGPAHNLVAMCKGQEDCFDEVWELIAKEPAKDSCPYQQLLERSSQIVIEDTVKNVAACFELAQKANMLRTSWGGMTEDKLAISFALIFRRTSQKFREKFDRLKESYTMQISSMQFLTETAFKMN